MFGLNLAALSEKRKVIAVELQGHGPTADIDRPLSFEAMAADIAELSASARRKIAAAQRARWARVKQGKKAA
jgi:hypothetical protein